MKSTATLTPTRYQLLALHQEIDLYDRKIAHFDRYEAAGSTPEARKKLVTKRNTLEKNAREMAAAGIGFAESELPRSFREPVAAEA